MIDIHTHILPGIDDGSKTDEDALEFARTAFEDGTRRIVATPHCKEGFFVNNRDDVVDGAARLRELIRANDIELELLPGAEVHLCPDLVNRVKEGWAPTLADNGKTVLLELPLRQYPVQIEQLIFDMRLAGLQILLAHPERIRYFQDEPSRYEEMIRLGAFGQLNTGSLRGTFGEKTQEFAEQLLVNGTTHVLASDAHNCRGRHPRMTPALEMVIERVGEARALAMVNDAPAALIDGRAPELPPSESPRSSGRSFFSRLFGKR